MVPNNVLLQQERTSLILQAVHKLRKRDAAFIRLRYGFDGEERTLEEIGRQFGISRERVRQRLAKLCQPLGRLLAPFVSHRDAQGIKGQGSGCRANAVRPVAGDIASVDNAPGSG
jgi:hypothetical protein